MTTQNPSRLPNEKLFGRFNEEDMTSTIVQKRWRWMGVR